MSQIQKWVTTRDKCTLSVEAKRVWIWGRTLTRCQGQAVTMPTPFTPSRVRSGVVYRGGTTYSLREGASYSLPAQAVTSTKWTLSGVGHPLTSTAVNRGARGITTTPRTTQGQAVTRWRRS